MRLGKPGLGTADGGPTRGAAAAAVITGVAQGGSSDSGNQGTGALMWLCRCGSGCAWKVQVRLWQLRAWAQQMVAMAQRDRRLGGGGMI